MHQTCLAWSLEDCEECSVCSHMFAQWASYAKNVSHAYQTTPSPLYPLLYLYGLTSVE